MTTGLASARARRPLPPRDALLTRLRELLAPEPAAYALGRSLQPGAAIDDVRVQLVDYVPGTSCSVLHAVTIDGTPHMAVMRVDSADRRWAAAAAVTPPRTVAPIAHPVRWDEYLGALVHWFPHDPALAVLGLPAPVLRALAGVLPSAQRIETLQYRPGVQALLRVDDVLLTAYAATRRYEAGVRGLQLAERLGGAGGPRLLAAHRAPRATAQALVSGEPVGRGRAPAVAARAGALLRELHALENPGLEVSAPVAQLDAARRSAAVVGAVAPRLARRVRRLVTRLELAAPPAVPRLVVAHGAFEAGHLLEAAGALVALDFDRACLAAPALDVATFAAGVASGRDDDLASVRAVLEATAEGYGTRPLHLEWHLAVALLLGAASPFRLQQEDWPQRTAAIVQAAEATLDGAAR